MAYTCQHCGFAANERTMFPCSERVCITCGRDRPLAWKAVLHVLARMSDVFPEELRERPRKRAKAVHYLQNLSGMPARALAERIRFDSILFREWSAKKTALQDAKGGQCAYSSECLEHMADWLEQRRRSGELIIDGGTVDLCRWESVDAEQPTASAVSSAVSAAGDSHVPAPDAGPPAAERDTPVDPRVSWQSRASKAMRKKAELQKSHDELLQRCSSLDARNKDLEARHATLVGLVMHLTRQITDGTVPAAGDGED